MLSMYKMYCSKTTFPSQNSVVKLKWCSRFLLDIALNAFGGNPLRPADLLFVSFVTIFLTWSILVEYLVQS